MSGATRDRVQNAVFGTVRAAVGRVPARFLPGGVPDPLITDRVALGDGPTRVDGPDKVTGRARFAAEVPVDGLVHAAFLHSPVTRGRIVSVDLAEAESAPGVVAVMTHRNAPTLKPPPVVSLTDLEAAGNSSLPIMQDDQVRWNGQIVAVVLAETPEQAEHATTLIRVDYERHRARTGFEAGRADAATPISLLIEPNRVRVGDAAKALAAADVSVDNVYRTPAHHHNAIELHAVTAVWDGDRLTVHDATQQLNATRATLATIFGMPEDHIRVVSPFVGGGFGGKGLWDHQVLAIAAARLAGRPVRAVLSREGVYRSVGGRARSEQRVALGADRSGRLTSLIHTGYTATPPHSACPEPFNQVSRVLYRADNVELLQRHVDLDMVANTFVRGPGEAIGSFALETALDELADGLGIDPIELRLQNEPTRDPHTGHEFSQRDLALACRRGAERFGWADRSPEPRTRRDGEWLIGAGFGVGTHPYVRVPGATVRITLGADGTAVAAAANHDIGVGTATAQAQHLADRLGLPLDRVRFELGDTDLPAGTMAGGSSQTASISAALMAAADALRAELARLVGGKGPLAGLKAKDLRLVDGGLGAVAGGGDRWESYGSILARAGRDAVSVTAAGSLPLEMLKYSMHSWSANFAEVRVSAVTGEVRVTRLLGSFDCGRILNRRLATSQFKGGMIWALGMALTEGTVHDERTGRIVNPSLTDYHIPVHLDVPEIEVIWNDIPDPRTPLGARGIGEVGITGTVAAIGNAVFNATGIRVRDLPISLDALL